MENRVTPRKESFADTRVYRRDQLVTLEDLDLFREKLLCEIRQLFSLQQALPELKWLKSFENRRLLKISAGTLQSLRDNGSLRFTKVGGIIYYRYEDIQAMLSRDLI